MTDDNSRLAVLIDADNTSPKLVKEMFEDLKDSAARLVDLAVQPAVVGERDVAHDRAVGVGSLTESQVHDHRQPQHDELR